MEFLDWYDRAIKIAGIKYELDSSVLEAFDPKMCYEDDMTPGQFVELVAEQLNFDLERNTLL